MTVRLDKQQKAIFDELCEQFGMSVNTAINIFVRAVIRTRRIPFAITAETDNDIRTKALNAFSEIRREAEANPEDEMSLEEINAEIDGARQSMNQRDGLRSN